MISHSSKLTAMLLCGITIALSGCVGIAARGIGLFFSDPRTKNHEYYAEVKLSLNLGDMRINATRYADVYYLTGGNASDYRFPLCNKADVKCWYLTDHFLVGLPNGDIVDIYLDGSKLSLSDMAIGTTIHGRGVFGSIYRNQPYSPSAKEHGPCEQLNDNALQADYKIPPASHTIPPEGVEKAIENRVVVDVKISRLNRNTPVSVFDPEDFYTAAILDRQPCSYFLRRVSANRTIASVQ